MTSPLVCRTFLCISDVIIAMQYYREITRLVAGETRQKLSRDVMAFAKQWMQFVLQRCERGRGMRPRFVVASANGFPLIIERLVC